MDHSLVLITTIAAGFGLALIFGFIAERLKTPALVGYLLAGIVIGPSTPGFVADAQIATELAEIGVMLLMFGVGLHFSIADLMAVRRVALPGAIVQMTVATLLGMWLASEWGWDLGAGLVLGLSLSCASTVVLLRALESRGLLETMNGRIAVGWLIVEDLVTVLILVLLPSLAGLLGGTGENVDTQTPLWQTIALTLLQVAVFIVLMLVVGRRFLPWLLWQVAQTGSRELFTLAVVAFAICIAYGAAVIFHVSFALGAFFAGMVMRESQFSSRAAEESLPLRDAFAVLFFVSVGMLFEPAILIEKPLHVLGVVAIIVVGKSIAALLLVLIFRYPLNTALIVAASLGQIGEFSFILAGLGLSLGLLPVEGFSLVLAGALFSIAFNPIAFSVITPINNWFSSRPKLARKFATRDDPYAELPMSTERRYLEGQVVLVGYGQIGKRIANTLSTQNIPYIVVEQNREQVQDLRSQNLPAVSGDASEPAVLIQAHIADAAMLVIAVPDPLNVRQMVKTAQTLNPDIEIVLRTNNEDESALLQQDNLGVVFYGKEELARSMMRHVLRRFDRETSK